MASLLVVDDPSSSKAYGTNGVARVIEVTPFHPIVCDGGFYCHIYYHCNYAKFVFAIYGLPYVGKFWSGKTLANCELFGNILLANYFFLEIQNYFS